MPLAIKSGGAWRYPKAAYVKSGGNWVQQNRASVRTAGVWRSSAIMIAALTVGLNGGGYGFVLSDHGSVSPSTDVFGHVLRRLEYSGGVTFIAFNGNAGDFSGWNQTNTLKRFTVDGITVNALDAWDFYLTGDYDVEWRYLGDTFGLSSKNGQTLNFQVTPV